MWNPRVEPSCGTLVWHPRVEPSCGTLVWNPRVEPPCGTPVRNPRVEPSIVWNPRVAPSCGTLVRNYFFIQLSTTLSCRMIVSARSDPVEMSPIGTPLTSSSRATYRRAASGSFVKSVTPLVGDVQPGHDS